MKIEEELKISTFNSDYQKAIISIAYTTSILNQHHSTSLKQYNITPEQFNILRILKGQHPKSVCIGLIQERMVAKSSNVGRILDRLYEKNYILKKFPEDDKRKVEIAISNEGIKLLSIINPMVVELESKLSSIDKRRLKSLIDTLESIREVFTKEQYD
jgi:DNA-binding MarR family transcriptional regulator